MADQLSRRQFLQWSTAVVAGSALAACAPAAMPGGQGGGEESSQTNLTLLYWEDFEGPMQAEGYMEMHPEEACELIPSGGEDTKLDAMIAAGTPPDLFTVGDGNFLYLLQGGVLLNLQPQV